jgi:hypothetical protein
MPVFRTAEKKESLSSSTVRKEWSLLDCPIMHMFR